MFSCGGDVEMVVVAEGNPFIDQPDACIAACSKCALGVSTWLQQVAGYDQGFMVTYAEWLRQTELPDLDNPRVAV